MFKTTNLLAVLLIGVIGVTSNADSITLDFNKNALRKERDESAHVVDLMSAPGARGVDFNKLSSIGVRLKSLGLPGTVFLFLNDEPVDSVGIKGETGELNEFMLNVPSTVRPPINNVSLRIRGWFQLVDGSMTVTLNFGEGAMTPKPAPAPEPTPAPAPVQPAKPEPPIVDPTVPPVVAPNPQPAPVPPPKPAPLPKPAPAPKPPVVAPRPPAPAPRPPVVAPRPPVRPPVLRPPVDDGRCYRGFCPGDHVVNDLGLSGTVVGIGPDPSGLRPGKCILVKWSFARDRAPACRFPGEIDKP